ncbi:glycogen debranching protein GlgX [Pelobacter propionicus]|uniref:Isoamylase n=1 Tax=Pelobacter propionicus (strain DSM 2379 / NBRC 103807 / OttBd1) TaxID=338966 RepID=A1AL33_PELPD|nr:glycogen debranching protein GlgX [Pelobacter propionicus]ABK98053.1 isoamylase [Pelobacter propionicus DSM 2379]
MSAADTRPGRGRSHPLGATIVPGGVNFSLFSRDCSAVQLLLFDRVDDGRPARVIMLDPRKNRSYHYWHLFIPGLGPGQLYGYRVAGPRGPGGGGRFDPDKLLLDPYGRGVAVPAGYSRAAAMAPGDNCGLAMKSVVADPRGYDWEGDAPLERPFSRTLIYELHLAGFTRHPSSGVTPDKRGTYAGLVEKIPYLQQLGVTAVELLPVFQFDPQDAPPGFSNYWGYSPVSFFAPHAAYSSRQDPLGPLDEFRDMVKALHRAGIEVVLDVVFNHTAEGDQGGATICYRGLANDFYYMLEPDGISYANYSGCGNTFNANNPIARRLIIDSLHHWVREMHVDGFRFDLASILSRDEQGRPLENPPLLWDIETDPALAGIKLIAEAWDAAGLYQVGSFIGDSWKEWNGRFRDDVRSFLRGDRGTVSRFASRLLASPDIYGHEEREAEQSINFVTCHDGFTLNDLVSFNRKHNQANGEDNRDGSNENLSWNCGQEGPSSDPSVEALRNRQVKNFLAVTLLALGTPMLLMGDEVRRTQGGNNNAYCQDNETGWFDWRLLERYADVHRFARMLIAARQRRDLALEDPGLTLNQLLGQARLEWHGVRAGQPDWGDDSHSIALTAWSQSGRFAIHLMVNAWREALVFQLPPAPDVPGGCWRRWLDTSLASPDDIVALEDAPPMERACYPLPPHSLAAMLAAAPSCAV